MTAENRTSESRAAESESSASRASSAPTHSGGQAAATLAALLPLAATAVWLRQHWMQVPERWPRHWDALGQVNGWGTRSVASVGTPLVVGAGVVVLMAALVVRLGRGSERAGEGGQEGVWRSARTGWAQVGTTWMVALLLSWLAVLPVTAAGEAPAQQLHQVFLAVGVFAAGLMGMLLVAFAERRAGDEASGTAVAPTKVWRAGVFYYNPENPALLVPKRLGWGWTLNFGHPGAWWLMGGLLLLVGAAPVLVGMAGR